MQCRTNFSLIRLLVDNHHFLTFENLLWTQKFASLLPTRGKV